MTNTDFWLVAAVATTTTCWVAYFMGMFMLCNILAVCAITIGFYTFYKLAKEEWS